MKNDANIRNFIEISGNLHGKSGKIGENRGISVEFQWNPFHQAEETMGVPVAIPVVFGRFFGHSRRKSENFGEFQRKSENIGENHSFSFHFITLSFHNTPILCSTTYLL